MAFAGEYMMHAGFGLGFLNFMGTILFFVFALMMIKFVSKGMRYSQGGNHGPSWRHKARERYQTWSEGNQEQVKDDAMQVARDRLANSELTPEEFEQTKQVLKDSQPSRESYTQHDGALGTARMRFAKGELSSEEFEAVLKALR